MIICRSNRLLGLFKYATRSPVPERVLLLVYNVGEPILQGLAMPAPS